MMRNCVLLLGLLMVAPGPLVAQSEAPLSIIDPLVESNERLQIRLLDRIVRANGTVLEGTMKRMTDDVVVMMIHRLGQTGGYQITERLDESKFIPRNLPAAVYKRLRPAMNFNASSVDHQLQLGQWCARASVDLPAEARTHLVRAVALQPQSVDAYDLLLPLFEDKAVRDKTVAEIDEELGVYMGAIGADVQAVEMTGRAASLLEALGDLNAAIRLLERFRSPSTDDERFFPDLVMEGQNRLASLLDRVGRREEARELVSAVREKRSGDAALDLWVLELSWLLEDAAAGYEGADVAFLEIVDKIIEVDPEAVQPYLARGTFYMLREEFDAAAQDFVKAIGKGAIRADQSLTYALNNARRGENESATVLLEQVRNVPDAQLGYRLVKAYLLYNQDKQQESLALLREVAGMKHAPWQARVLLLHAEAAASDDGTVPDQQLDEFLSQHHDNPAAFAECALLKGSLALRTGGGPQARRWLAYARTVRPRDDEVLLRVGCAELLDGGDLMAAGPALSTAYALSPESLEVVNALGTLEYREGNLEAARAHFESVQKEFPQQLREEAKPPAQLAFAMRGLRQIQDALNDELWVDRFDRENNPSVLNKWEEIERYGVTIELADRRALFQGTQKFNDDDLSLLYRIIDSERLSRVRCRLRLAEGASQATVALRLEATGGAQADGLVLLRYPDGRIGFSLNRGENSDLFLPPEQEDAEPDPDAPDIEQFDMERLIWEDDGQEHVLEIRFQEGVANTVELYFDGQRLARNVSLPASGRRGALRLGVSGRAPLNARYKCEVLSVEVFRRVPPERKAKRH